MEAEKMGKEYSRKSNVLESVAVDNLMKMRLDKLLVIRMESRQREWTQRKLELGTWNESKDSEEKALF